MTVGSVEILLCLLDDSYDKRAWQGPNLRGSLRGVGAAQAAWRPAPGRHNIWEIVVHAAYWKYATWRLLTGQSRRAFGESGSNWFVREGVRDDSVWRADVAVLDAQHRKLREAVSRLPAASLSKKPRGSKYTTANLVYGVASHDVYHTGQIQLVKRLWGAGGRKPRAS